MNQDTDIRHQAYQYFAQEAPELLQALEQDLFSLAEERSLVKVHNLMRTTHTLKGAAANVGLDAIKTIAHHLEDVFKTLYNPDVVIDSELEALLLQGYECLRLPLMAEIMGGAVNNDEITERAVAIFAKLQDKLGDYFDRETPIPTSVELGFDITQSIFEVGVKQRLESLSEVLLTNSNSAEVASALREQAEIFLGLAESLNLPGFGAIAFYTLGALDTNPDAAPQVIEVALKDFEAGWKAVLAGDRIRGGEPSLELQQLAETIEKLPILERTFQLEEVEIEAFEFSDESSHFIEESVLDLNPKADFLDSQCEEYSRLDSNGVCVYSVGASSSYLKIFAESQEGFEFEIVKPELIESSEDFDLVASPTEEAEIALDVETSLNSLSASEAITLDDVFGSFAISPEETDLKTELCEASAPENVAILSDIIIENRSPVKVDLSAESVEFINEENEAIASDIIVEEPALFQIDLSAESVEFINEENEAIASDTIIEEQSLFQIYLSAESVEFINEENEAIASDIIIEEQSLFQVDLSTESVEFINEEIEAIASDIIIEEQAIAGQNPISKELLEKSNQAPASAASNLKLQPSSVPNSPPTIKAPHSFVRVDLELLERLSHIGGELLIKHNRQVNINEQLQAAIAQLRWRQKRHQITTSQLRDWSDRLLSIQTHKTKENSPNYQLPITNHPSPITNKFDSLELDRHSELHILLQSVLEEMVQLEEATDSIDLLTSQSSQILEKQRRLLKTVQEDMQEARMSPMGDIFNRFSRLLKQLSVTHKKPVELTLVGTDILVDRALAEKLYDPLLHLIRNAFDHGIESAEIRAARGKKSTGKIEIRAYHQGNQTIVEVRDDGGGIDCDRVRQRAVELHWMSAEQASKLSAAEVFDLLFQPGFSTASKLSDLSGRGVGLDVVRTQMQALSGSVVVRSQPKQGTTFLLQFPLSLTMAKLMVCEAGGTVYALLSDAIEQILIPKSDQIQHHNGQKVLHLNQGDVKTIVPAYNMTDLLQGRSPIEEKNQNRQSNLQSKISNLKSNPMLLIRQSSQSGLSDTAELLGLEVDQILGEQELVIRPLGKAIAPPSYIYGASTLADGRLTLAIDSTALINTWLNQVSGKLQTSDVRVQIESNNSALNLQSEISNLQLLVVDDSISVRQTLALTLQKAGYKVLQAQNGREAIQQLQHYRDIRLVLCDIEMPSMNGFEFLSYCRQDEELAKIPTLMLTSRTAEKHRQLAFELGAVGYFNKPFKEQEILPAIANLISN